LAHYHKKILTHKFKKMKLSKKLFSALAFLFILTISVSAQRGDRGSRGDRERSPEKTAERQTARLVESLDLDEAQAEKVQALNLVYAEKIMTARKEAREKEEAEREKNRELLKSLRDEQEAELIKLLTPEQAEKLAAIKTDRKGKGRRGARGPRGATKGEGKKLK